MCKAIPVSGQGFLFHRLIKGAVAGLAGLLVWFLSYLGWVSAHLIWGVTLGELTRKLVKGQG